MSPQVRRQLSLISARALSRTSSLVVLSHFTRSSIIANRRCLSRSWDSSVGNSSGRLDGSSTIWAKMTARAAASGLRAHQRWSVLGCPCLMDFSRAEATLIASSGSATSMSFFLWIKQLPRFAG